MCETLQGSIRFLNVHIDYIMQVIMNHHNDRVASLALEEAKLINHMIFTKITHLKKLLEGVNYCSEYGRLNTIIDPTIIAILIRNIYETIAMFNLVYIQPKTNDEKLVLYNLWVHAGLSYRQRFKTLATTQENEEKCIEEEEIMIKLETEIKETELYKSLTDDNQKKIKEKLKKKDYKIRFDDKNNVVSLSWQEISNCLELKKNLIESLYTYCSLYAHPSNVSVFQFKDLFGEDSQAFEKLTVYNLKNAFALLSIFIADYIRLFPNVLKTFETLPIERQIILNCWNRLMRGDSKSINAAWKNLG